MRTIQDMGKKVTGFANQADEEAEETLSLAELLTINMNAARLYRMQGSAMEWKGIHHGDLLLVERTTTYQSGDIVIAEIDGEQLVRTIKKDHKGTWFLEGASEGIARSSLEACAVIARVRRCIKCYD